MGTHPIFESDFDCLTEKMSEKDHAPKRPSRKRTSPGRSKAFHYGDFDLDGDSDAALAVALAASQSATGLSEELDFQTSLETSQLGAATAKHEHIQLPPSPDAIESDESKAQDIIGLFVFFFRTCSILTQMCWWRMTCSTKSR